VLISIFTSPIQRTRTRQWPADECLRAKPDGPGNTAGERSKAHQASDRQRPVHASLLLLHSAAVRPSTGGSERAGRHARYSPTFPALHACRASSNQPTNRWLDQARLQRGLFFQVCSRIAACDACDSTVTASPVPSVARSAAASSLSAAQPRANHQHACMMQQHAVQNLPFRGYSGWSLVNSNGNTTTPPVMQSSPAVVIPRPPILYWYRVVLACMHQRPKDAARVCPTPTTSVEHARLHG
jgi:hypothetical protein